MLVNLDKATELRTSWSPLIILLVRVWLEEVPTIAEFGMLTPFIFPIFVILLFYIFKTPVTSIFDVLLLKSMLRFGVLMINLAADSVNKVDAVRVILATVAFKIPVEEVMSLLIIVEFLIISRKIIFSKDTQEQMKLNGLMLKMVLFSFYI